MSMALTANRFECEWEQENSPTRGMTETAARAYYKANSVAGDCRFALRDDSELPAHMLAAWMSLAADVLAAGKETKAHRDRRDAIRDAVRCHLGGYAYRLPEAPVAVPKATRKPARMTQAHACPQCGFRGVA